MTPPSPPYHEPLRTTLLRTTLIALVVGGIISLSRGNLARWPLASLLILWPSFGGHWIEVWFLNCLRPHLASARPVQIAARFATWFVGGILLALGLILTAKTISSSYRIQWQYWWIAGLAFIAVELIAHIFLQLRGRPSFYNGRG